MSPKLVIWDENLVNKPICCCLCQKLRTNVLRSSRSSPCWDTVDELSLYRAVTGNALGYFMSVTATDVKP